jgi:hypothetical protein
VQVGTEVPQAIRDLVGPNRFGSLSVLKAEYAHAIGRGLVAPCHAEI